MKIVFVDLMDRKFFIFFFLFCLSFFLFSETNLYASPNLASPIVVQVDLDSLFNSQRITIDSVKSEPLLKTEHNVLQNKDSTEGFSKHNADKNAVPIDSLADSTVVEIKTGILANDTILMNDSLAILSDSLRLLLDSLILNGLVLDSLTLDSLGLDSLGLDSLVLDSLVLDSLRLDSLRLVEPPFEPVLLDTILLRSNPLFIDLVYRGVSLDFSWPTEDDKNIFLGEEPKTLYTYFDSIKTPQPQEILTELRHSALNYIAEHDFELYKMTFSDLPVVNWHNFETLKSQNEKTFVEDTSEVFALPGKIEFRKRNFSFWNLQVRSTLQFSQISVSDNWHKGGNSYLTVLGNVSGRMDYDDRKKIKWENNLEIRTGFNAVEQDSLRPIMPSDDLVKGSSKFGLKASKYLYYSSSMEVQTQLFNNPKKINSRELKAKFLTPVRMNIGVGIDYKPNKVLSVALSPFSYKVIYLADTARNVKHPEATINPNAFGIKKGDNFMHEFGSKLIVVVKDYKPLTDLKIDSRFSFYTNYEKVEVDWEIIAEYALNRFFSTRLLLNPRFDNTAILKNDEKARLQMKQILTVGIAYRFY